MLRTGDVLICITVIYRQPAKNPADSRCSISVCGKKEQKPPRPGVTVGRDSRPALLFASWEALDKPHRTG